VIAAHAVKLRGFFVRVPAVGRENLR